MSGLLIKTFLAEYIIQYKKWTSWKLNLLLDNIWQFIFLLVVLLVLDQKSRVTTKDISAFTFTR